MCTQGSWKTDSLTGSPVPEQQRILQLGKSWVADVSCLQCSLCALLHVCQPIQEHEALSAQVQKLLGPVQIYANHLSCFCGGSY